MHEGHEGEGKNLIVRIRYPGVVLNRISAVIFVGFVGLLVSYPGIWGGPTQGGPSFAMVAMMASATSW